MLENKNVKEIENKEETEQGEDVYFYLHDNLKNKAKVALETQLKEEEKEEVKTNEDISNFLHESLKGKPKYKRNLTKTEE